MSVFKMIVYFLNHLYFKFVIAKTRFLSFVATNYMSKTQFQYFNTLEIPEGTRKGTSRLKTRLLKENYSCKLVLKCKVFSKNTPT